MSSESTTTEENSGKLAALVREHAARVAREQERELIITDGPPGVGCPVISSVTGADMILVVSEPTQSGLHDLDRVLDLAGHFGIPALVAVNKADINPELAERIEERAGKERVVGRIPFDTAVTAAQLRKQAVVECAAGGSAAGGPAAEQPTGGPASARSIRAVWQAVSRALAEL